MTRVKICLYSEFRPNTYGVSRSGVGLFQANHMSMSSTCDRGRYYIAGNAALA